MRIISGRNCEKGGGCLGLGKVWISWLALVWAGWRGVLLAEYHD